jgi:hypothetical protein
MAEEALKRIQADAETQYYPKPAVSNDRFGVTVWCDNEHHGDDCRAVGGTFRNSFVCGVPA